MKFRIPLLVWAALLGPFAARAAEILSARFSTSPVHVFVNQTFDFLFEVELTPGDTIQNLQIGNFPQDRLQLQLGQLEELPKRQETRDGRRVDVIRFSSSVRAGAAGEQTFNAILQGMLTERQNNGFFFSTRSRLIQKRIEPFTLRVETLPTAGQPRDFSGAIGLFRLTGGLSSSTAQPGDILTLTLDVAGEGNLNNARPLLPDVDGFKTYPPKALESTSTHLKLEQVYIPKSIAATTIPAISLSYFNPEKRRYETASIGPFRLRFTRPDLAPTNAVRIINTLESQPEKTPALLSLPKKIPWKTAEVVTRETLRRTEVRLAPARSAYSLFILPPKQKVIVLETQSDWVRIDLDGRRGWLPAADLSRK